MGEHFGAEVRRLRLERQLTVRQVSEALGMSETSYHAYERGVAVPPPRRRPQLAETLGVDVDEIENLVEEDEYEVFLRARSLSDEGRAAVRDFMRRVREREGRAPRPGDGDGQ